MRTIPRSLFKSYAKDLSVPMFELVLQHQTPARLDRPAEPSQWYDLGHARKRAYTYASRSTIGAAGISPHSSMDSGLEAFSRNPAHGSFSALTFPSTDLPIM